MLTMLLVTAVTRACTLNYIIHIATRGMIAHHVLHYRRDEARYQHYALDHQAIMAVTI